MLNKRKRKNIIYLVVLLLTLGLTIGFSAFQNELFINDILLKVRLQRDVRVSESVISKSSGAVVNDQEYNKTKLLGNVTFDSTSSYVLYKVDLTNYGNVKSGLLDITGDTGLNVSICDSNGSNCTNNLETPICNGSNCTLGATKELYVKVSSTTSGTKNIDLDLDIQPYVNVTYDNIRENTNSFKTEVLETSTYQITLTSKPEEVEVSGDVTASYNKTTGVLVLSNIKSDLTIQGKYLINTIAETSYTGTNPDNYVRFNNTLYRIITKENIDDGYGNTELRTKITSNDSIGSNVFDDESNEYGLSSIKDELNTTYYNSLNNISKELIDTVNWTSDSVEYVGLIKSEDYTNNSDWLIKDQYTLTTAEDNKIVAVTSTGLVDSEINVSRTTFPTIYLKTNVLIVGGNGTESNPYILDLSSNGLQPNPTVISGRNLTVTGSNQELVTVSNKVGTVYYNSDLNPNIPTASEVGTYKITYYIPEGNGYKAKTGSVTSTISGLTFTIAYQKGSNVSAIGKTSDSCTTSGSNLSCSVTLPTITPNNGYESVGWSLTNGDTAGVTGSYTLNSTNNNSTLYANAVVKHNYQNTTTLAYYGTLNDAFNNVSNNQTIKVLQDVTETTNATLAEGKTGVKLDLNGKTITMNNAQIANNGTLDIYNTSSTDGEINGGSNQVVLNNGTLTLNGTSSSNKVIINKTANTSFGTIYNSTSKSLTVNNNVEIKVTAGSSYGITNYGTATITGGTITGSSSGIYNDSSAELNISGNNTQITGTSTFGIINYGIATILGGTITGSDGISNQSNGELNISGSNTQITGTSTFGITNYGTATITGGAITGPSDGIRNDSSGELNISGSSTQITGTSQHGIYNSGTATITGGTITGSYGIDNLGTATITGGTITGTSYGIDNSGTFTIEGGTISGNGYGIYNSSATSNGITVYGNTTITGGTITGNSNNGIIIFNGTTVTLGTNDSSVSTTSPVVQTLGTSIKYGVYIGSEGTFNFYDGVIKSNSGSGYAINSNPTNMPSGYKVQKVVSDGVESAYLTKPSLLMSGDNYFSTSKYLRTNVVKKDIESITFSDNLNGHTINGTDCWDVSKDEDEGVLAWVIDSDSNGKYEMTIGANGKVYAYSGYNLFSNLTELNSLNGLDYLDTSNVTNMSYMFQYTGSNSSIFTLNLGDKFDTSNVIYMDGMFYNTGYNSTVFTLDLGDKFDTSNVKYMNNMFYYTGLNSTVFTLDLGEKFDTSNVIDMNNMFNYTGRSNENFTLDLGDKFDTSNVTNMTYMFIDAGRSNENFTLDLGEKFDTSNVTKMEGMFAGINLVTLDLGEKFNTSNVIKMDRMFINDVRMRTIYAPSSFVTTSVTSSTNMFSGCSSLVGGAGTTYSDSNPKDKTYAHIDDGTSNPGYFTAIGSPLPILATFYYNSNTNSGSFTKSSVTAACVPATTGGSCTITVPSVVTSSVGKYNSAYKGVSNSTGNMNSSSLTISDNTTYYANYSSDVTIYYPSSTTARSSTVYKRNEYFSSDMNTVLGTNNTATSNFTFSSGVSGYELYGFANNASTNTRNYSSVSALAQSDKTTSYAVLRVGKTATVYYNSGSGDGTLSVATATTATAYQYVRCTSAAAELSNSNYTIPASVSGSVGQYGNTYINTAGAVNTMSASKSTAYTTLYAIYRNNNVTNYYYGSSYTNRTLYRNNMFTSTTAMKSVLSTSGTGTSNYSTATGPGSSVWTGLSTGQDTTTEYSSVANAAASSATTLYTVYTFNVNYTKDANISSISKTSDSCKITTSSTSCSVIPPTVVAATNYAIDGWEDSSTGIKYPESDPIVLSENNKTYNATSIRTYTVTFNPNGGSTSEPTRVVKTGSAIGTLPTATNSTQTFLGWFTSGTGGSQINASTVITSDKTYFAHWSQTLITNLTKTDTGSIGYEHASDYNGQAVDWTREYEKLNSGFSLVGFVHDVTNADSSGPILVSTVEGATHYTGNESTSTSFSYRGKTWYATYGSYYVHGSYYSPTTSYPVFSKSGTSTSDYVTIAKQLIDMYYVQCDYTNFTLTAKSGISTTSAQTIATFRWAGSDANITSYWEKPNAGFAAIGIVDRPIRDGRAMMMVSPVSTAVTLTHGSSGTVNYIYSFNYLGRTWYVSDVYGSSMAKDYYSVSTSYTTTIQIATTGHSDMLLETAAKILIDEYILK